MRDGRRPTPTHLKLLTGNPGKRPLNRNEPRFTPGVPEPPEFLDGEGLAEWHRVVTELAAVGVLAKTDRAVLTEYCVYWSRWVAAEAELKRLVEQDGVDRAFILKTTNGNRVQNPLVGVANVASRELLRAAVELGLTPSARSRIAAHKLVEREYADRFFD